MYNRDYSDVILCRCENLSWHDIQVAIDRFHPTSLRQLKLLTRWGMGICQGRVCRPITAAVDFPDGRTGLDARPPLKAVNLGVLGGDEVSSDE